MNALMTRKRWLWAMAGYVCLGILAMVITPLFGSETISLSGVWQDVWSKSSDAWGTDTVIFVYQRLPRTILGFLVGGSLALTGCVFQVILRNPLAAPSTLGVASGSTVGAVLAMYIPHLSLGIGPFSTVQVMALLGAGLALLGIYYMARRPEGLSMNTLLLTGVTISIICSAIIPLIKYLANPHLMIAMDRWMMGGLDVMGFRSLAGIFPLIVPGLGLMLMQTMSLNHLSMGDEMAMGHGVDVEHVQRVSFLAGSLITAGAVSLAGPIFFVGLIVPHIVRRLSGFDHRIILPGAFMMGGAFLIVCDTIARIIIAPTEMPVGIITAITGGPFFIFLLLREKK